MSPSRFFVTLAIIFIFFQIRFEANIKSTSRTHYHEIWSHASVTLRLRFTWYINPRNSLFEGRSILNAGAVQTASSLSLFPVKKACKDSLVNFRYRRYASPLCLGHRRIALLLIGIMEQDIGFEPTLIEWKSIVLTANTNPAYNNTK